jgi:hypothetical protein
MSGFGGMLVVICVANAAEEITVDVSRNLYPYTKSKIIFESFSRGERLQDLREERRLRRDAIL